jgi:hypothetical protein
MASASASSSSSYDPAEAAAAEVSREATRLLGILGRANRRDPVLRELNAYIPTAAGLAAAAARLPAVSEEAAYKAGIEDAEVRRFLNAIQDRIREAESARGQQTSIPPDSGTEGEGEGAVPPLRRSEGAVPPLRRGRPLDSVPEVREVAEEVAEDVAEEDPYEADPGFTLGNIFFEPLPDGDNGPPAFAEEDEKEVPEAAAAIQAAATGVEAVADAAQVAAVSAEKMSSALPLEVKGVADAVRAARPRRPSAIKLEIDARAAAAAEAKVADMAERAAAMKRAEVRALAAADERARKIQELEEREKKKAAAAAAAAKGVPGIFQQASREVGEHKKRGSELGSRGTIAGKIILPSIRLEKATPDQQAIAIHGRDNFTARTTDDNACCALCGFKFSERQGQHRKTVGLSISYDHFVPVNFAAIVFRVYSTEVTYSDAEFDILSKIGDMVCWHCNFEKSQMMFLTCPTPGSFTGMSANPVTIGKFLDKMLKSKHASGIDERGKSTLLKCITDAKITQSQWVKSRLNVLTKRADDVATTIRTKVDYKNAKQRYLATRILIAAEDQKLGSIPNWSELSLAKQYIERRKRIAALFALLEGSDNWVKPWKSDMDKAAGIRTPTSGKKFSDVICVRPPEGNEKGGRRKTHRRRRLPKLL